MNTTDNAKLYFLCKKHIQEDLEKCDIKEIAKTRFSEMTESEFNTAYSDAFTTLNDN